MSDINLADVTVNLMDVYGKTITDKVKVFFYFDRHPTLNASANLNFRGVPLKISGIPAFPIEKPQIIIQPNLYRSKSFFKDIVSDTPNDIKEIFFINPSKANPKLMEFADIASKSYGNELRRILDESSIDAKSWNNLDKRNRATILNLSAKMSFEKLPNGQPIIELVERIEPDLLTRKNRARIFARVNEDLLTKLRNFSQRFRPVSGISHSFPNGWNTFSNNSFKSRDEAGNIQFTFATNNDGLFLADIDLDDHTGIKHAFNVIQHTISGVDTDPYDIHQILLRFQQLNPEYLLL